MVGPVPSAGVHHRYLVTPVIAGEALWGYFVMMEYNGRFGPLDGAAARRSAVIIALEFAARRRSGDAEAHAREVLLRDLIRGVDDEEHTMRRAGFSGLQLDRPYLVCTLRRREEGSPPDEDEVELALTQLDMPHLPGATTVESGSLVLLVEIDPAASRVAAVARAKQQVDALVQRLGPDVLAALSTRVRGAARLPASLRGGAPGHAVPAQPGGATSDISVLAADDLGAGRLFLAAADRVEADRFVRDTLGPLVDAEDPRTGDLLCTLQVFFDAARSVRQTATRLGVHENTIRYRLTRVAELTGMDAAADADHQLAIQVALRILWLERRLPVAEPLPASV